MREYRRGLLITIAIFGLIFSIYLLYTQIVLPLANPSLKYEINIVGRYDVEDSFEKFEGHDELLGINNMDGESLLNSEKTKFKEIKQTPFLNYPPLITLSGCLKWGIPKNTDLPVRYGLGYPRSPSG